MEPSRSKGDVEAGGDALVEGGEDPQAELAGEGRLAQEDAGEGALGVHVQVGEQAEFLQLGLVDHDDHPAVALGLLGFQQELGLGHHLSLEEAGAGAQGGDHGDVQTPGSEGWVGDVDDLVAERVEQGTRGADGHGLAAADLPGEDAQGALGGIPPYQSATLIAAAVERLQVESSERGRRVVVICDEAHLLATSQLEELRFLLSSEMDSRSLFSCLLVGQPTLRHRHKLGAYAALD